MAAHSYWRLLINSLTSGTEIGVVECEMRPSIGGADQCNGGTAISDGSYSSLGLIFDNNYYEFDYSHSSTAIGSWFGYHFVAPVSVAEIRLRLSSGYISGLPSSFSLEYSDDGSTWTNAITITPISWVPDGFYAVDNLFTVGTSVSSYAITGDVTVSVLPQGMMSFLEPAKWNALTGSGISNWYDIASSDDGVKLAAIGIESFGTTGYIYTSGNSGRTWNQRVSAGLRNWRCIDVSSDGSKIVAGAFDSYLCYSSDYGVTWSELIAPGIRLWDAITISGDGLKIVAGANEGYLYTSNDSGNTWQEIHDVGLLGKWYSIASSSDGAMMMVAFAETISSLQAEYLYISVDFGNSWFPVTTAPVSRWVQVSISGDGTKIIASSLIAETGDIRFYKSTDSGTNWYSVSGGGAKGRTTLIKLSRNGNKLVRISNNQYIAVSDDFGDTWGYKKVRDDSSNAFWDIALSGDGLQEYGAFNNSYIYTSNQIVNTSPIPETIAFSAPISFGLNVTSKYNEIISFGAPIAFNANRGRGNYLALAHNTENKTFTTFNNLPFEYACNFNGKTLFAGENGLFEYGGTTDNGTAIVASIKTDKSNKIQTQQGLQNSQLRKRLPTSKVYINAEASGTLGLNVTVDGDTYAYTDATIKAGMAVHPVKVGRGLDGVHWQLEVENFETLESIEFEPVEIRRRGK